MSELVKSELVQLVESSGLEKTKQNQIAEALGSFFKKASEWDDTIKSIVITSPDEAGKMKMAKEGRLTLKNMRLDAEKIVKAKRDEVKYRMANDVLEDKLWLKAGQMMEATFKNLETKLEEKEKFAEIWEANRKSKLKSERIEELDPYSEFVSFDFIDLGGMSIEAYENLLNGAKLQLQAKEDAIRKSEEERIKKEKEEEEERERIRVENEKLKAEQEALKKQLEEERIKADNERKIAEEAAKKEREEQELKLKAEQEANAKLEAEIKAKEAFTAKEKKDAEDKRNAEIKAKELAEKKAQSAPDKIKLIEFANDIDIIIGPYLISDEAKLILNNAEILLTKVSTYIREKSENL